MANPAEYRDLLEKHGLPDVEDDILDVKYVMRRNDWYVKTRKGWWYCRIQDVPVKSRKWQFCPMGPS